MTRPVYENDSPTDSSAMLRLLPSIDEVLRDLVARHLSDEIGHEQLAESARTVVDELRSELRRGATNIEASDPESARDRLLREALRRLEVAARATDERSLRRVINATGVILHTNLGRAPLALEARRRLSDEVAGYCTLEYETKTGERGRRAPRVEELLTKITGAEAAFVVNNCAAAAVLVLAALAADGETIISRGELVEIGGDFRIPDVMRASGTTMVEVGTTNRTRLADYESAINERTRLICRVHPSNYRVVGFTAGVSLAELSALAHKRDVTLYEDAGSGQFYDMNDIGLTDDPVIPESVRAGADVVSFSGDKLLGGPQAGIIIGRRGAIERIRRTPLARALRADKLVLGALEATLEIHARGTAGRDIPAIGMLRQTYDETRLRTETFTHRLRDTLPTDTPLTFEVIDDEAAVGGGSAPLTRLPTAALRLAHRTLSAADLARLLRTHRPPVVARVVADHVLVNLRTVSADEEPELLRALSTLS